MQPALGRRPVPRLLSPDAQSRHNRSPFGDGPDRTHSETQPGSGCNQLHPEGRPESPRPAQPQSPGRKRFGLNLRKTRHLSRCLRDDKSDVAYFANEPTKTLKISICNCGAESHLRGDFCGGEGGDVTQESPARMHRLSGFRSDHTSPPHSLSLRVFSLPPSYYRDILVVLTCEVGSHVLSMGRVCRSPNESSSEAVVSCADSQIQLQQAFVHAIGVHKSVAVLQRPHLWWGLMDIVRFFHHHVFLLRNQFSSSSENLLGQVSWISRSEGTLVLANGYSIRSREPQETSRIRKFTARDCLSFMGSDTRRSAQKINHESLIYIRIYELRSFLINASKVLACVCRTQHSRKNREAGKLPDNLPEALIEKLSAHVLWAG
ncbi:hypothetical protein MG293_020759 [Ovis ammon polii]|uniref:Uncharacterized protein n=1 Tax=Ovis ammon polii TaxID=230172 RepID=A0AAD4TP62_OVIAM|nr:hypothetical protein MG293_020759 [Ovis ammon polii]KAI4549954.1 hypothetical protein MJT46_019103 [Ovis ammon polii x Ovis aries]